ncbi:MAG: HAD family hydrolase [Terrimicrobiaceae bacterium]|nr:HAD family hydrolase [Terrimicrobiaceae bacterium]
MMDGIRAVICDVYRTLLEVLPAPVDAGERWRELWTRHFAGDDIPALAEISNRCRALVAEDHTALQALGLRFPEIFWSDVMCRAIPNLQSLENPTRDDFIFEHAQLLRGVRLMPGAAAFLRTCVESGLPLGIASNAQRYTLRECGQTLATAGLSLAIFDSDLTLWSWQLGFSKPDPHLFRILTARLVHRGIVPDGILMIGDRRDNDIEPARACGWRAAQIDRGEESWREIATRLFGQP